jgi:hypothetical protein
LTAIPERAENASCVLSQPTRREKVRESGAFDEIWKFESTTYLDTCPGNACEPSGATCMEGLLLIGMLRTLCGRNESKLSVILCSHRRWRRIYELEHDVQYVQMRDPWFPTARSLNLYGKVSHRVGSTHISPWCRWSNKIDFTPYLFDGASESE